MVAAMIGSDEFSRCLLLNTIMTARALSRRYDEQLRPFGVSVVQFSIMAMIRGESGETVSAIAERISMDRTTLSRNLDLLERKRLVSKGRAARGNAKSCKLTRKGDELLDRLIPVWRAAQKELLGLLAGADGEAYLATLRTLTKG